MTPTAFAEWLQRRQETASQFNARTGLSVHSVYFLAGYPNKRKLISVNLDVLKAVAAETGIDEKRLASDAIAARREHEAAAE